MNRQLTCLVSEIDTSLLLAQELVHFGFINEVSGLYFENYYPPEKTNTFSLGVNALICTNIIFSL